MMRRIMVIGCSGAGKTTLSRRLGAALDLPVTHLDRLYWRPGWVPAPEEEFHAAQREIAASDGWVIDGNYSSSWHIRMPRADTVIFLDFPRRVCLRRVLLRTARDFGKETQAPGCPEKMDWEFFTFIWQWPSRRPRTLARLDEHGSHVRRITFTRPREVEEFLRRMG